MENWISFIYLFGVGGALFGLAIVIALKKRVLKLERLSDRLVLIGMIGTYLAYFSGVGLWNVMAIWTAYPS